MPSCEQKIFFFTDGIIKNIFFCYIGNCLNCFKYLKLALEKIKIKNLHYKNKLYSHLTSIGENVF